MCKPCKNAFNYTHAYIPVVLLMYSLIKCCCRQLWHLVVKILYRHRPIVMIFVADGVTNIWNIKQGHAWTYIDLFLQLMVTTLCLKSKSTSEMCNKTPIIKHQIYMIGWIMPAYQTFLHYNQWILSQQVEAKLSF